MRVYQRRSSRRRGRISRLGRSIVLSFLASLAFVFLIRADRNIEPESNPPIIYINGDGTLAVGERLCGTVHDGGGNIRVEAKVGGRHLAGSPDTSGESGAPGGINHFCFPVPPVPNLQVQLTAIDKDGNTSKVTIVVTF